MRTLAVVWSINIFAMTRHFFPALRCEVCMWGITSHISGVGFALVELVDWLVTMSLHSPQRCGEYKEENLTAASTNSKNGMFYLAPGKLLSSCCCERNFATQLMRGIDFQNIFRSGKWSCMLFLRMQRHLQDNYRVVVNAMDQIRSGQTSCSCTCLCECTWTFE